MPLKALDGTPLPAHDFQPGPTDESDPEHPDTICMAALQTGNEDDHGYVHLTQCGHRRSEHEVPVVTPYSEGTPAE